MIRKVRGIICGFLVRLRANFLHTVVVNGETLRVSDHHPHNNFAVARNAMSDYGRYADETNHLDPRD